MRRTPWQSFPLCAAAASVWALTALSTAAPPVILSEFLASNQNGIRDEDGDRSDWIELHHSGTETISLAGLSLSDNPADPQRWQLPPVDMEPGTYRVIFASGKDRRPPGGPWHTSFRLDAAGEFLALYYQGSPLTVFAPAFPPQSPDVSFGFLLGPPSPQFMTQPSPGAPNIPSPPVAPVTISPPSSLFTNPISVTLSQPAGATIFYTLDGSPPQPGLSPIYSSPIVLTNSTRLRTVAQSGAFTSSPATASWIRVSPELAAYQSPLPLLFIDNFGQGTIPSKGWSSDGSNIRQVPLQQAAWILIERSGPNNTTASAASPPQSSGLIGIRTRGAVSTSWAQKPYSVHPLGPDGLVSDASPLDLPPNDEFALYYPDPTGGDFRDPTMLFNTFAYDLSRSLGRWAARFRFTEAFINEDGGITTLTDRRGIYALLEKVSRGPERLDFDRLSSDGSRGGALLSINRMDPQPVSGWPSPNGATTPQFFHTAGPDRILQSPPNTTPVRGDDLPAFPNAFINFDQPSGDSISSTQRASLELWFSSFENVLYNDASWRDPAFGWRSYLVENDWASGYLLHNLIRHSDALRLSLYPWLGNDRKLRMGPVWDVNFGGYFVQGQPDSAPWYRRDQLWFPRLFADPDFAQRYTDIWSTWRRTGLSDAAIDAIIDRQAAEITPAKAIAQGIPSAAAWTSRLDSMKSWLHGRAAFFDTQFPIPPSISPPGGTFPSGTTITLTSPAALLWSSSGDPRLPGGNPAPAASSDATLTLSEDVRITARSRNGTAWSGPLSAVFAVNALPATSDSLLFSEIHYHPAPPSISESAAGFSRSDFEFLELFNPGPHRLSLADTSLSGDVSLRFSDATRWSINPGERLVLAANRDAFLLRYGPSTPVAASFSGNLSDSGGTVTLASPSAMIASVSWNDKAPWPTAADGGGWSLTRITNTIGISPESWRTSVATGGSPGTTDHITFSGPSNTWPDYAFPSPPVLRRTSSGYLLELSGPPGRDDAIFSPEAAAAPSGPWSPPSPWTFAGESRPDPATRTLLWSAPNPPPFTRIRAVHR